MPRIVTALFKDRAPAQQALQALMTMGIAQHRITAIGLNDGREVSLISGFRTLDIPDEARPVLQGLGLPASDMTVFEHGIRRGCSLIAAQVEQENLDEAIKVLGMFDPLDLDRDSREWAQESDSQGGGVDVGAPLGAGITGGNAEGQSNTAAVPGMGTMIRDGSSLGTADLRADEFSQSNQGSATTAPTGQYTDGRRENLPGVNELGRQTPAGEPDTGMLKREMNRGGPIWTYGTD